MVSDVRVLMTKFTSADPGTTGLWGVGRPDLHLGQHLTQTDSQGRQVQLKILKQ